MSEIPGIIRKPERREGEHRTSAERKAAPVFGGCFVYFPDALLAVAELSKVGNDKHNPGQPLHWSREKSNDHADCVGRHLLDIGPEWTDVDPEDGLLHAQKLAWRALATLQVAIERVRESASKTTPKLTEGIWWTAWNGGSAPLVPMTSDVEVKLRDGYRSTGSVEHYHWHHDNGPNDIVAYRVVP